MFKMQRTRAISIRLWILFGLLGAVHGLVFAQGSSVEVPENAHAKSYGNGWECDRGYRAVDGTCIAVKVPANGYFVGASYGVGWKCDRGYRKVDEACVTVEVPENAHLDYSGNVWECNRPYRKQQDECGLR